MFACLCVLACCWLLLQLSRLGLAAEHGALISPPQPPPQSRDGAAGAAARRGGAGRRSWSNAAAADGGRSRSASSPRCAPPRSPLSPSGGGGGYGWMGVARQLMAFYCSRTDGAFIEEKSTSLLWQVMARHAT